MVTTTGLMTVEQFWEVPDDHAFEHELHNGKLVKIPRPMMGHIRIRSRTRDLLEPIFGQVGIVATGVPFRPLPEYELRAADVAFVSLERWDRADGDDALHGAPEVVIEVLSPSDTVSEIAEYCALCLENGAREFWTVDAKRREINVSMPDGVTRTYKSGDSIPLALARDHSLAVDAVFEIE